MIRTLLKAIVAGAVLVAVVAWAMRLAETDASAGAPPITDGSGVADTRPDIPGASTPAPDSLSAAETGMHLQAARAPVLDQLRDPTQARFRNERVLQRGQVVCLEVAAADNGDVPRDGFAKAVVITRPDRPPSVWIDRGREVVAHTACEVA